MLENLNFMFFFIFLFEVLIKLTGLGFSAFFYDGFNIFDLIIILISCVDSIFKIILAVSLSQMESNRAIKSALSTIRAFRLLRIFKLATTWKKFKELLLTIWKTLKDISTFTLLLTLFTYIYALLGMELFAFGVKKTSDDKIDMINGQYPLNNFNSFWESMLTMFVLLTGDQWSSIMLDYYRSISPVSALLFFVSFMILG